MVGKISALISSKVAIAALGGLLLVGGGATATVAATGHMPSQMAFLTSTHARNGDSHGDKGNGQGNGKGGTQGNHANTVAIQGTLTAYDATHHAILVSGRAEDNDNNGQNGNGQNNDDNGQNGDASSAGGSTSTNTTPCSLTSPFTIALDSNTKINGQAKSESELASHIGSKVEVQADETSNCALLATKVTVSADDHQSDTNSQNFAGTVGTVGTSSFTLQPKHGSALTVNVTSATKFEGATHSLADLKAGMNVVVDGTTQSSGSVQASRVKAEAGSANGGNGGNGD